jgi:ABC-type nitrate/sulfonate/bicarbonate transport system substrate-binding protein
MDSHPEIAEQLRKDPSLVNNMQFVENHPALQQYIQQHPEVREEISENPKGFMQQEERFDRREDQSADRRDDDVTRRELASFDRFMDSHPEIAEQLRKDPSLVNNMQFVENHPALQQYIQQHPEVREEISENPKGFMQQEERFDRREDHRDHDFDRAEAEGFGHFLGDHSGVASQLSRNPSLANNEEFVESHPDLQQYLKEHPGAQKQLTTNPQNFIQSAQQLTDTTATPKTPLLNPQPKQQK